MSDAWQVASIKSFEQVPVAPTTAMLRVSAVSSFRALHEDERPTLVADDGRTVTRFVAVPAPADANGLLRCAYSVPTETVTSDTVFSLEFRNGYVIALPHPVPGATRLYRGPGDPAPRVGAPGTEGDRRSELAPKLAALSEELAALRRDTRHHILHLHLQAAERAAELQALRDLSVLTRAAAPAQAATIQALEDARQTLADAEVRIGGETARADAAERERGAVQSSYEALAQRLQRLETDAREAAHRFLATERERDAALDSQRAYEDQITQLNDELHTLSLERDELTRQASAFDGVAVTARERLAETESQHRQSSARLAELEVWSAELERRLAHTTSELAQARGETEAAQAAAPADDDRQTLAHIGQAALAEANERAENDLAVALANRS